MSIHPSKSLDLNPALTLHPNIAHYVANIIALWNSTEYWLTLIFSMLGGTEPRFAQLTVYALRNSAARLDVIKSAGEHALSKSVLLPEFRQLMTQLRKAVSARNRYAHSIYAVDEKKRLTIYDPSLEWGADTKATNVITLKSIQGEWKTAIRTANNVNAFNRRLSKALPQNHPWHALPDRFR